MGLLGAIVLLIATHRSDEKARGESPTIVDVAPGLTASQIAQVVHLQDGEHVIAVDDHPVTSNLDAGTLMAEIESGQYVDLTIRGDARQRRVIVLVH
ncbi:MAG TPA: hypothetical protein VGC41_11625 [Kofleriaceae bacterium]